MAWFHMLSGYFVQCAIDGRIFEKHNRKKYEFI